MPKYVSEQPDLTTQNGRLRWARIRAGYSSMRGAALSLGWPENTYKSHELGLRRGGSLSEKQAKSYARAFKVSVDWLLTGNGSPTTDKKDAEWAEMSDADRAMALDLVKIAKKRG